MNDSTLLMIIAAALIMLALSAGKSDGEVYRTDDGRGVITVAPAAPVMLDEPSPSQPTRGTFSTYTTRRSTRLDALREINKPPPPPPAPETVVIVNQQQTTNVRLDRARHDRRMRKPRHYRPAELP